MFVGNNTLRHTLAINTRVVYYYDVHSVNTDVRTTRTLPAITIQFIKHDVRMTPWFEITAGIWHDFLPRPPDHSILTTTATTFTPHLCEAFLPYNSMNEYSHRSRTDTELSWSKRLCSLGIPSSTNPIDDQRRRLRRFAKATLAMSFFFWVWAIHNTYTMAKGHDLGIFSFFGVVLTSFWLLTRKSPPGRICRFLVVISHLVVAANYRLGVKFASHFDYFYFGLYCKVFTVLWIIIACTGFKLISKSINTHSGEQQERFDEERNGYRYTEDDDDDGNDYYNDARPMSSQYEYKPDIYAY